MLVLLYFCDMKQNKITLYIDLLFCLVFLPMLIMILPVDKWIVYQTTGQPHQNSIQNMFCNRFVKIVLKKMCYLGNKADIADSKTLTMKNNLSDWIFYVSILQPKSFDYDS